MQIRRKVRVLWVLFLLRISFEADACSMELLADLAVEFEVSHFIYSSIERGGEGFDYLLTLDRAAKARIERHIKKLTEKGLKWT